MTPVEFEQKYHRIRVPYQRQGGFADSRLVNVHIYCQTGPAVVLREKDALVRSVDQEVHRAGGLRMIDVERNHRMMISRAFYGKGSPNDCAIALKHALRYGRTQPDRLQQYCDQVGKIGIDCSGFVNNYFRATGRIAHDKNIAQYAHGTARDDLANIQAGDVLIWTNSHGHIQAHPRAHIAILNSTPDRQGHAVVVESAHSLSGLTHSTYTFTRIARNLFRVQRPSGTSHVRVYAVN